MQSETTTKQEILISHMTRSDWKAIKQLYREKYSDGIASEWNEELFPGELSFISRTDGEVNGHLQLIPLQETGKQSSNVLLIGHMVLPDGKEGKALLQEASMCAWELGYKAIVTFEDQGELMENGFYELDYPVFSNLNENTPVYGYALSWKGTEKIKRNLVYPHVRFYLLLRSQS
ncbi:GNAT family N-acetyltransferase [Prolixibacter denitrificans]|nr:hypothetical protein [Prolixibacter denitrificans]PSK85537.1 putative N-acetyltransferase YhbS [Prolixibacter denitrificans]